MYLSTCSLTNSYTRGWPYKNDEGWLQSISWLLKGYYCKVYKDRGLNR